tara:strand:- start:54 stop:617 length:564 start_codon:yes stop_codon:yes gene_type:complete
MKISKTRLRQIIKEELKKESLYDNFADTVAGFFDKETKRMALQRKFKYLEPMLKDVLDDFDAFKKTFSTEKLSIKAKLHNHFISKNTGSLVSGEEYMKDLRTVLWQTDSFLDEYFIFASKGKSINGDVDAFLKNFQRLIDMLSEFREMKDRRIDYAVKKYKRLRKQDREELKSTYNIPEYNPENAFE